MKNLLLAAILLLGIASCTPVRYVMIDPKDSTKVVEIRKRVIYDDTYLHTPLYFNYWGSPYYRFNYSPRIVVPIRPTPPVRIQPSPRPMPKYMPRGGRH